MSSVAARPKTLQANNAYFVNIGDIRTSVLTNGGTTDAPFFSTHGVGVAAQPGNTSSISSLLANAGKAFLRDMGQNIISSGRVFRKVQLLVSSLSTSGVGGPATGSANTDYLSLFIELPGLGGIGSGAGASANGLFGGGPAAVARVG